MAIRVLADEMGLGWGWGRSYKHIHIHRSHVYRGLICIHIADEMGLGKTAQSLSLLQTLRSIEGILGPSLIVVPLSTIPHWERELAVWTDMYIVTFHGSAESRRVLLAHDWKLAVPRKGGEGGTHEGSQPSGRYKYRFHVVLTTYETVVAEPDALLGVKWAYLIVDEGHRLKNRHSRSLDVMKTMRARRKLVLTGTPLQNHVSELWSILSFLEPAKVGGHGRLQCAGSWPGHGRLMAGSWPGSWPGCGRVVAELCSFGSVRRHVKCTSSSPSMATPTPTPTPTPTL